MARVTGGGSFNGPASPQRFDRVVSPRYAIKKNAPLSVTVAAADNCGPVQPSWRLELSGAASGTITDQVGPAIRELEANYPVGSVLYKFSARARDVAGNLTLINTDVDIEDDSVPPVTVELAPLSPLLEDTYYDFVLSSPVIRGGVGQAVNDIPAVTSAYTNARWSAEPEVVTADMPGRQDLTSSLQQRASARGPEAEVQSVRWDADAGVIRFRMRLLEPGARFFDVRLRRKFDYQQIVGSSRITKTEKWVSAANRFSLDPQDITPPAITLRLRPGTTGLPRTGAIDLSMNEEPRHCEPRPAKRGTLTIAPSPGLDPDFAQPVQGQDGPYDMARAADRHRWTIIASRLRAPAAPLAPGTHVAPRDAFVPEDVPLPLTVGESILVTDNAPGMPPPTVTLEDSGRALPVEQVARSGFPTPNYLPGRRTPGAGVPVAIGDGAPVFTLTVAAADASGNRARLELPIVVLDITPPRVSFLLSGQDSRIFRVAVSEVPPSPRTGDADAPPGEKRFRFQVIGAAAVPPGIASPRHDLVTRLVYPPEGMFYPSPDGRLEWTYGLYSGNSEANPANRDADFTGAIPRTLAGAFMVAGVRILVGPGASDNHPSPRNQEALSQSLRWQVERLGGSPYAANNPAELVFRAPNYPRSDYPREPEYRFDIVARDEAGNGLRFRFPIWVVGQKIHIDKLRYESERVGPGAGASTSRTP
jgi:hypothetical protein